MSVINILVRRRKATRPVAEIVCGNADYQISFNFDSEWDAYDIKTARFIWGGKYVDVVFTGNLCKVPVITNTTLCAVGVYAGDLYTTTPALIRCHKSILCNDGVPADPLPEVYAQIMEILNLYGKPTDEQTMAAVNSWLNDHPEATTTVQDGAVTTEKLSDGSVTPEKLSGDIKIGVEDGSITPEKTTFVSFDHLSENLFNYKTAIDGKKVESSWIGDDSTGTYSVSDYIPVEPNTVYNRSKSSFDGWRLTLFYDANKKILGNSRNHSTVPNMTTPDGCAYVVIDMPTAKKEQVMFVKGEAEPSEYIPYKLFYSLDDAIYINTSNIKDLSSVFEAIPEGSITKAKLSDEVVYGIESVDSRIKTATRNWTDASQLTKTHSGRVNVFENVVEGTFDIATDVSDKTIVVHGVNCYNPDDRQALIPVEPGQVLYWNRYRFPEGGMQYITFKYYDANQELVRSDPIGDATYYGQITIPDGVYYLYPAGGGTKEYKFQIASVDLGDTAYGYDVKGGYFGKVKYFPYVGYRIENGVLVGASDTYTIEELMHVDVFDSASTIEVTVPVEGFDRDRLRNVLLKYGRAYGTDYIMARVFKNTVTGDVITPKVVAFDPGGKTMTNFAQENDFVMAINAGVFDMTDNSCVGNTIANGEVITDHRDAVEFNNSDTLAIDSSGNLLSYEYSTTIENMLSSKVKHAVQGKGTLIVNYAIVDMDEHSEKLGGTSNVETKHPRTVIGQYKNGDYMVFLCGGRETNQAGMTMHEVNEILVAEGVKYAYNLDGGGSCNMRFFKKELAPYTENRANPTYIVFN